MNFSIWLEAAEKKLILMRGVSGSGKSTIAKSVAQKYGGVVFSTDDYFMKNGKYEFDPRFLGKHHSNNIRRTEEAMMQGVSPIIIDNTNSNAYDMKPYVNLADKYGYAVQIKQPGDPDFPESDFEELMHRQSLRVSQNKSLDQEVVRRMLDRFHKNVSVDDIRKIDN